MALRPSRGFSPLHILQINHCNGPIFLPTSIICPIFKNRIPAFISNQHLNMQSIYQLLSIQHRKWYQSFKFISENSFKCVIEGHKDMSINLHDSLKVPHQERKTQTFVGHLKNATFLCRLPAPKILLQNYINTV